MFLSGDLSFYILSLGCSKNLVDSERINGTMFSAGFKAAESSTEADIIIINTCGFIHDAKTESIEVIFDSLSLAESSSETSRSHVFISQSGTTLKSFSIKVVVLGCLSQRYFDDMKKDIPEIDLLLGIPDDNFVTILAEKFNIRVAHFKVERKFLFEEKPYSYIKISDGCDNDCSFCAIPLIRGSHVSFSPEFILHEARHAVRSGARELIIIAQDIAVYRHSGKGLVDIVNEISEIDGVRWIRLLYCHPDHITDRIIDLIAQNDKVVPYLDLPFQHANGRVLASMGRKGNLKKYDELVKKVRARIPGVVIRSTFIVGYPGETEEEFEELITFLKSAKLDKVGCFSYSPEEDTRCFDLGDDVPTEVKQKRNDRLMEVQREISLGNLQNLVGQEVEVLIEDRIDEETWLGRSVYDAPEVDGVFYLTTREEPENIFVKALVVDAVEYDLIGEML